MALTAHWSPDAIDRISVDRLQWWMDALQAGSEDMR